MELLQLVEVRIEEMSRPLREEVAALKLLLARGGDSLEPAETCRSDDLGLPKARDLVAFESSEQKSSMVEDEQLFGCFSPRGPSSQPVVSAASQCEGMGLIMPQALGIDTVVSLSPESCKLVVPIGDGIDKSEVLTPLPGAVVAREICDFLATLVAACPGSNKSIGCKVKS